jgi:hypothetical protein
LDLDGIPIAGVEVSYTSPSRNLLRSLNRDQAKLPKSLFTNANGRFEIEAAPPAVFRVEIEEWGTVYEAYFEPIFDRRQSDRSEWR